MSLYRVVMNDGEVVEIEATSVRGAWLYTDGAKYVVDVEFITAEY